MKNIKKIIGFSLIELMLVIFLSSCLCVIVIHSVTVFYRDHFYFLQINQMIQNSHVSMQYFIDEIDNMCFLSKIEETGENMLCVHYDDRAYLHINTTVGQPLLKNQLQKQKYYFATNGMDKNTIFSLPDYPQWIHNARIWEYQRKQYFIKNNDNNIPCLYEKQYAHDAFPVLEGVKSINYTFLVKKENQSQQYITAEKLLCDGIPEKYKIMGMHIDIVLMTTISFFSFLQYSELDSNTFHVSTFIDFQHCG